jgi:hypothetical protein
VGDGGFDEPVSLPGESALTYAVELAVGDDGAAWAAGLSWGDEMAMEEGHDHHHGSGETASEQKAFEVLLWRVGTDRGVAVVEDPPVVDRTTQGYDISVVGSTPIVVWIEGSTAKLATIEVVGAPE